MSSYVCSDLRGYVYVIYAYVYRYIHYTDMFIINICIYIYGYLEALKTKKIIHFIFIL